MPVAEEQTPRMAETNLAFDWRLPSRLKAIVLTGVVALCASAYAKAGPDADSAIAGTTSAAVSPDTVGNYLDNVTEAWQTYVAPDGQLIDPLAPDSGNGYSDGADMMADAMLQAANRTGDPGLEHNAERVIGETANLDSLSGTFNLLSIETFLEDGQAGRFSSQAWSQISGRVTDLASRIESTITVHGCLSLPNCYSNWRLVWSTGAAALLASGIQSSPETDLSNPATVQNQIRTDLAMAVKHAGRPATTSFGGGPAQELSDPLSEPESYQVFSSALLEWIKAYDPQVMTTAVRHLQMAADHYALDMMAPDGQLSMAGRSLDQSWVQAAAADLGARRAEEDPAHAAEWRSFADRAFNYLVNAYQPNAQGLVPIVPGLAANNWQQNIMDPYAHEDQYAGLTDWFLTDAFNHWPSPNALRAPIPADRSNMLVDDLNSSGLVWGRSGNIWWDISGRTTAPDPRFDQGLVDVKIDGPYGWRDLLALRPIDSGSSSSIWQLSLPGGEVAVPRFTKVRGNGHHVVLDGVYRQKNGKIIAPARWLLTTTKAGVELNMTKPDHTVMRTTFWSPNRAGAVAIHTAAIAQQENCTVTASGPACPTTVRWLKGSNAKLLLTS